MFCLYINLRPAKHTNVHQEHVPTSLSSFPMAIYFLLAGSEHEFFCPLNVKCCVKKCVGCIARVFIEMSARIVNMEKVWLLGVVGAWDQAPRWGKKAKKGNQIGKISASTARSRLPHGLLRSSIFFFRPHRFFFLFPPMRSLVPGYYERGTNHT